jgi:hypothetical protein
MKHNPLIARHGPCFTVYVLATGRKLGNNDFDFFYKIEPPRPEIDAKWKSNKQILFLASKLVKSANVGQKMSSKITYENDRTQNPLASSNPLHGKRQKSHTHKCIGQKLFQAVKKSKLKCSVTFLVITFCMSSCANFTTDSKSASNSVFFDTDIDC